MTVDKALAIVNSNPQLVEATNSVAYMFTNAQVTEDMCAITITYKGKNLTIVAGFAKASDDILRIIKEIPETVHYEAREILE